MNRGGFLTRGQIALEFVMVMGVAVMIMMLFLVASGNEISNIQNDKVRTELKDVLFRTQNEINLASEALPGYERQFENPDKLSGTPYTINSSQTEMTGQAGEYQFLLVTPEVIGSGKTGYNLIRNVNGIVCLNAGCSSFDFEPPTIYSVMPVNGSIGINPDFIITVDFSEAMNSTSVDTAFTLSATSGTTRYNDTFYTMTFTPDNPLTPNTTFTATVTTTASDLAGNNLATNYVWQFTTGADTTPPGTITGLMDTARTDTTITWNWTIPTDSDYSYSEVWIDGAWVANETDSYIASGFIANTSHNISVRTYDSSGNVNSTWVNDTGTTSDTAVLIADLWEIFDDLPAPVDFTFGLNSTADTFGLGNGNDGWDNKTHPYDNGAVYFGNPTITDIVQFDATGGLLEITLGGYGSPVPTGPAYNDPISAAYGVEFTISTQMQNRIDTGGTALLEFDWESEDTTGIEHAFEAVWVKGRFWNSSGSYYIGSDIDSDSNPADDDDLDATTDSTNDIYYALQPMGADAQGHYSLNVSKYITDSGNYYLDIGGKFSDWSAANEVYIVRFDNINLTIT